MTEPEYENRFLPMDQFMPNYSEKYYMYIIDLNDLYYMDANAKVCFIFEQDKMADLFDCVQMDGDNFLAVTAEDDSTVLTINTPNSISAEMLDSLDFNKGYAEVRIDGQNFTLGKYVSDNTSYSYYFSFPPYKVFEPEFLNENKPDVLVYEVVERDLGRMGRHRYIMHVAEPEQVSLVGLMRLRGNRISEKQKQVYLVAGNARRYLLSAALHSAHISLYLQAGSFRNKLAGSAGSAEIISAEDAAVGYAELHHQFFFCIMSDKRYIQNKSPQRQIMFAAFLRLYRKRYMLALNSS